MCLSESCKDHDDDVVPIEIFSILIKNWHLCSSTPVPMYWWGYWVIHHCTGYHSRAITWMELWVWRPIHFNPIQYVFTCFAYGLAYCMVEKQSDNRQLFTSSYRMVTRTLAQFWTETNVKQAHQELVDLVLLMWPQRFFLFFFSFAAFSTLLL